MHASQSVVAQGAVWRAAYSTLDASSSAARYVRDQIAYVIGFQPAPEVEHAPFKVAGVQLLARWCADPDSREALLGFGGDRLLDFVLATATEDPSSTQALAEEAAVAFLSGEQSAQRLLQRPGAVPRLLRHVCSSKASDQLAAALAEAAPRAGACDQIYVEDVQQTLALLTRRHGAQVGGGGKSGRGASPAAGRPAGGRGWARDVHPTPQRCPRQTPHGRPASTRHRLSCALCAQVQQLATLYIHAWAKASGGHRLRLAAMGVNTALAEVGRWPLPAPAARACAVT